MENKKTESTSFNHDAHILYVVIPCYNEEEVLNETARRLKEKLESLATLRQISHNSRILFVDDGSKDRTWDMICQLHNKSPLFSGVKLAHNKGHQNALLAGLTTASLYADIIISMDADLQDDIHAIDDMIRKYEAGNDIVYGIRKSRKNDTFFKRFTAENFYKFMAFLGVETIFNHADYRLMSRRSVEALMEYREVNLFLRGIIPQLGFRTATVGYDRGVRFAAESKYPLQKMLSFAFEGITSFSIRPIRLITIVGFLIFGISAIMLIWSFVNKWIGNTVQGWTSLMISIWMIGGLQILSIGIIGEYIGKTYKETKHRPRYIIEETRIKP